MKAQIAISLILIANVTCRGEQSQIVKQADLPVAISQYAAVYLDGEIHHSVILTNASSKEVVRVLVGFASFDAFNDFVGGLSGWVPENIKPSGKTAFLNWKHDPPGAYRFDKYGVGAAYVKAVRFADGSVWKADMEAVFIELQKIAIGLKKQDLQEQKKGD